MLNITIAQINPTIGDIAGNLGLIEGAVEEASRQDGDLVVFPELALTGYYPADLLDEPLFKSQVDSGIEALCQLSAKFPALHIAVGTPSSGGHLGKRRYNSLFVFKAGSIVLTYHKQLLPTYNIFDERRHFEPGPDVARVLKIKDTKVGFLICEDGWNDKGRDYPVNPFVRLSEADPDLVVSINASPSNVGKRKERERIFVDAANRHQFPIVYVNQVGGHDQLIYDGASFIAMPGFGQVYEAVSFGSEISTHVFDTDNRSFKAKPLGVLREAGVETSGYPVRAHSEFYRRQIELGLKDYARRCGFKQAVVGCSGGIDSALTIALAAETLGSENVLAVTMPSSFSSEGSVSDSQLLCDNLGVKLLTHPIADLVQEHKSAFEQASGRELAGLALENLQARIRGTILMEYSNSLGHLLLTTGNKSEISVGYCTLYGDTNGGLGLIGDLYKTEVFDLAKHLNVRAAKAVIPLSIIHKAPSAELAPDQKDTDSLPPYDLLDEVLKVLIEGKRLAPAEYKKAYDTFESLTESEEGLALIAKVRKMIARNEYKRRQAAPILRVRSRAFGSGRQMPIAAKY